MQAARDGREPGWHYWVLLSILLHVAAFALLRIQPRLATPQADRRFSVEILTPRQFDALSMPPPSPNGTGNRPQSPDEGMVNAQQLYSTALLRNPANRQAREALGDVTADERALQLCNSEAVEQVRRRDVNLKPDFVIAYARSEIAVEQSGDDALIRADGAALRSGDRWYELQFHCHLTADMADITSFQFRLGAEIERQLWDELGLPGGKGGED